MSGEHVFRPQARYIDSFSGAPWTCIHRIEVSLDGKEYQVDAVVSDVDPPVFSIVGRKAVSDADRASMTKRAGDAIAMTLPMVLNPKWAGPRRPVVRR